MDINNLWAAAGLPVLGWGLSVERRLARIDAIKEKVDDTGNKIDKLVDHLISKPASKPDRED